MVTNEQRRIVLASGSPRRRELLEQLGFELVVLPADVPEQRAPNEHPHSYTRRLAETKALAAAERLSVDAPSWVLAADTIVVCDADVLEKPLDAADAEAMLSRLSGRWHEVVTSFCWRHRDGRASSRTVSTRVKFRELRTTMIRRYVDTGEPMDKAGAYGIQDIGGVLVDEIEGSYHSVVGLPVCQVVQLLEELDGLTDFPFLP